MGPLTQLFNESLPTGIFPTEWKIAHVKAIHKSGIRGAIENYRQISLLSCVGKVMAKLMCSRLTKAFGNIISERQHGFLSGRSTTTNLMEFVGSVKAAMEGGNQVDALYLDFSKAFDCLNHGLLVEKLRKYGVGQRALDWFSSYLSDQRLHVKVENGLSSPYVATSGVPQGSHLGPVLFLVYVQDLVQSVRDIEFSLCADDLKLNKTIRCADDCLLLQSCLDKVSEWGELRD